MVYLVALVTLVLATASATRLVTTDKITKPLRMKVDKHFGDSAISYVAWCDWCSSVWIAALFTVPSVLAFAIALDHWPLWLAAIAYPNLVLAARFGGSYLLDKME